MTDNQTMIYALQLRLKDEKRRLKLVPKRHYPADWETMRQRYQTNIRLIKNAIRERQKQDPQS